MSTRCLRLAFPGPLAAVLLVPPEALAIKDPENQGRWESKPAEAKPQSDLMCTEYP